MKLSRAQVLCAAGLLVALTPLGATTLQQLSLDEMTQQSTSIVRGRVTGSSTGMRGSNVWTFYQVQVLETFKGHEAGQVQVAVPGGAAGGVRQMVAGAPSLSSGSEYVLFLWTGRSGLTQVMGLSQGLLSVIHDGQGNTNLVRPASKEIMLDSNLKPVMDQGLRLRWSDFRSRVASRVGAVK